MELRCLESVASGHFILRGVAPPDDQHARTQDDGTDAGCALPLSLRLSAHRTAPGRRARNAGAAGLRIARCLYRRCRSQGDPAGAATRPAAGTERARGASGSPRPCRHEPRISFVHRHGIRRVLHTSGDPAERTGEPRLVYRLHAVSGGNRPGQARGAAQLPDHGVGPDRTGSRQRIATRRSDGCRRGDEHEPFGECREEEPDLSGGRSLPSPDDRGGQNPGRGARHHRDGGGPGEVRVQARRHRGTGPVSGDRWRGPRFPRVGSEGACGWSSGHRGDGPSQPDPPHSAGRVGCRHCGGQQPAIWRSHGLRWSPCCILCNQGCLQAHATRAHHRRVQGPRWPPGAPHGAADAGAAHQARQGDQQRVYRAGSARRHGQHVRGVSWPVRASANRRAGPHPHRTAGQRAPTPEIPRSA